MSTERMNRHEVEIIRRSVASTNGLTQQQALSVLAELERTLLERDELRGILDRLSAGPWPGMRELLTEMHRLLHP